MLNSFCLNNFYQLFYYLMKYIQIFESSVEEQKCFSLYATPI